MSPSTRRSTNQLEESEPVELEFLSTRQREAAIQVNVLRILGRPTRLFRVAVMPLWDNNYRVNVLTGEDASSVSIPDSYFVTADDSGRILRSMPPIRNQYPNAF